MQRPGFWDDAEQAARTSATDGACGWGSPVCSGEPARNAEGELLLTPCRVTTTTGNHTIVVAKRGFQDDSAQISVSENEGELVLEPAADPGVGFADGGTLSAKRSHSRHIEASTPHIASPDVHVNHEDHCIVMYYHGLEGYAKQSTRVAISRDGLNFTARPEILGRTYFRVFRHEDLFYALAMPGQFYRSRNRYSGFEPGPLAFNRDMRHSAVMVRGRKLYVFWTQVGHAPESILLSTVELPGDWQRWRESEPVQILRPEFDWEGADAPLEPSIRSTAYGYVNQMRDPAIFVEAGSIYLLYAVAGESGIAIARVIID